MSRVFEAWKRADIETAEMIDGTLLERTATNLVADSLDEYTFEGPGQSVEDPSNTRPASIPPLARPSPVENETVHVAGWAAEACHAHMASLVQRIFMVPERADDILRSIVFADVDGHQGSALLSAATAEILSCSVVGSVCLVDANFLSPSLHRLYGLPNDIGVRQAFSEGGSIRRYATRLAQGQKGSLWLLPAGRVSSSGGNSFLTTELSRSRLQDLRRSFDHVIIEAAPVRQDSAASILGAQVDGAVLIVDADVTRRHVAQAAGQTLRASGVRVLGAVLKNRRFPIPETIYRWL